MFLLLRIIQPIPLGCHIYLCGDLLRQPLCFPVSDWATVLSGPSTAWHRLQGPSISWSVPHIRLAPAAGRRCHQDPENSEGCQQELILCEDEQMVTRLRFRHLATDLYLWQLHWPWDCVVAICNPPSWLPTSKVSGGIWIHLTQCSKKCLHWAWLTLWPCHLAMG